MTTLSETKRYQAYPEYKNSGVEWLGEVPSNWKVIRGKWIFTTKKIVNKQLQCMERLALTMNGVIERSISSDEGLQPSNFSGYQIFEENDLVFKLIDLENFKTSRVGLVHKKGIMSPAYIRICPMQNVNSKYYYYFYFDLYLRGVYNDIGGQGVRSALNSTDLLELSVYEPSPKEQTQIANFLDHETAKIDTLFEKQKQLIQLLKEKRQAVISHAVTKGLNPQAPMKDSGIEWLGEVPEHWGIIPLKFLVTNESGIQMGPFGGMLKDLEYEDTGYKLYGQENTISGDFNRGSRWLTARRYQELKSYELLDGDLVLTRKGSLGKARRVEKLETQGVIDSDTIRIRVNTECLSSELLALLMHEAHYIAEQITRTKRGSVLPGLNSETISNLKIVVPKTLSEQKQLVDKVKQIIIFYDHAISNCFAKCELLKERRTALISAAVTGKIDVRNWQAPTSEYQAMEQTA